MPGEEDLETKAGRAPALKVGGTRIATRNRTTSEEVKPASIEDEEEEKEEDQLPKTKENLVLWGQTRDVKKDYPSQAVQDRQNKPQPTHPPHDTRPATAKPNIIQQPRK